MQDLEFLIFMRAICTDFTLNLTLNDSQEYITKDDHFLTTATFALHSFW